MTSVQKWSIYADWKSIDKNNNFFPLYYNVHKKMFLIDTIKHEQDLYEKMCKELLDFDIIEKW